MTETISTIYFLFTRSFLHLFTSAAIYFIIKNYIPISKVTFLLILLPLIACLEYHQYIHNVADNASRIALVRDTVEILLITLTFVLLYIFKKTIPTNFSVFTIATLLVLLLIVSILVEHHKPTGQHLFYKSFLDIAAYTLGPFTIYPLLIKIFKL